MNKLQRILRSLLRISFFFDSYIDGEWLYNDLVYWFWTWVFFFFLIYVNYLYWFFILEETPDYLATQIIFDYITRGCYDLMDYLHPFKERRRAKKIHKVVQKLLGQEKYNIIDVIDLIFLLFKFQELTFYCLRIRNYISYLNQKYYRDIKDFLILNIIFFIALTEENHKLIRNFWIYIYIVKVPWPTWVKEDLGLFTMYFVFLYLLELLRQFRERIENDPNLDETNIVQYIRDCMHAV